MKAITPNPGREPLWRREFPLRADAERYVSRRQFAKFLVLTSLGMFAGNLWIFARSLFRRSPAFPTAVIARASTVPVGGVKLFTYPGPSDPCILVRAAEDRFVAYSQKCTHLSCAVIPEPGQGVLRCPCHDGYFDLRSGDPKAGPPRRPLPRITLDVRGQDIYATGVEMRTT